MFPAARVGDLHTCPLCDMKPHVGGPVLSGCSTVMIGGMAAARLGDSAFCVLPVPPPPPPMAGCPPPPPPPPAFDVIVLGSATVMIGGKPAARFGDATSHGGLVTVGFPRVNIG